MNDKFVDEVSDLTYFGFRYYDKSSMTWTQSDPFYRFAPDAAWSRPRNASLYTAHLNNPIRYIDPDGRSALTWLGGVVVGGLEGAAIATGVGVGLVVAMEVVFLVSGVGPLFVFFLLGCGSLCVFVA